MQFSLNGNFVRLQGLQEGIIHIAFKKQLAKLSITKSTSTILFAEALSLQLLNGTVRKIEDEVPTLQLQNLLQQYAKLFEEPTRLPPKRDHDHHIPLKDEKQVVKMRPYRYLTV